MKGITNGESTRYLKPNAEAHIVHLEWETRRYTYLSAMGSINAKKIRKETKQNKTK